MFSQRTHWNRQINRLSLLLEERSRSGLPILNLTVSNPTECNFPYPSNEILASLSHPSSMSYAPDPRGLLSARQIVSEYYVSKKSAVVEPSSIFLTASTSESYSFLCRLLCNGGDEILIPRPSYPLFDYLLQLNDVRAVPYHLFYDDGWYLDIDSIRKVITARTRAVVIINPHNPAGMFLKESDLRQMNDLANDHRLALISDEVFSEYTSGDCAAPVVKTLAANPGGALTFVLNGISKMFGLPQLKLGWIAVARSSSLDERTEAIDRLDIIADTFLSVNAPVQHALPAIFSAGKTIQSAIRLRIETNRSVLRETLEGSSCSLLRSEGGWSAILQIPRIFSEEECAAMLLSERGVFLYPGYFFDFPKDGFLVLSLLAEEEIFREAVGAIKNFFLSRL